jgi:glycosyltransferase involved in cell wall biosynthesis
MKICYFSCSTIYGGVEKIVVDTLNEISKYNDCCLVVPKGCLYKEKLSSSVKIYEYNSYDKRYNIFLYLELFKIFKNYDIVHSHAAKASQITYILSKFLSFIHIATKHNIRKGKIFNKIKNVISVSAEVAKTITHFSKTLYFGLPLKNLEKQKQDIFTITAVGRLDPIKGFDSLINEVSKLNFDFRLNIIGDGKQKEILEKLIVSKNLQNRVFLLGFKDNIIQYLKNSDLQVISSLSEGLPITLMEGLLYCPIIISTPVGGITEVIHKDFLVEIDNFSQKINDICLNYDDTVKNFALKHDAMKEKFRFDTYESELISYYKGCLDAKAL